MCSSVSTWRAKIESARVGEVRIQEMCLRKNSGKIEAEYINSACTVAST
jgi:hypothetical protein